MYEQFDLSLIRLDVLVNKKPKSIDKVLKLLETRLVEFRLYIVRSTLGLGFNISRLLNLILYRSRY